MGSFLVNLSVTAAMVLGAVAAAGDDWPQFRGPNRDGTSRETGLVRHWPDGGPPVLWSVEVCEGYAGPAVVAGRVYFNDYDVAKNEWLSRCVTLDRGEELWRFREERRIRPNHGITRTVPAVDGKHVFALDPKCVLHCLDASSGTQLWRKDLVSDYKARIPPWYNGQCPLLEPGRLIIAVGGDALAIAFDTETGNEIWRTPNPQLWEMSHASLMPAELGGVRQYLYCTLQGLMGIAADDGRLLWHYPRKFNVAVAPSPLAIDGERIFMTSGYEAGSVMIRVKREGDSFRPEPVFELGPEEWNSEVQTPILFQNHMFAVGKKQRGRFACLDFDGKRVWESSGDASFDLGNFLLADGMLIVLDGRTGTLRLIDANFSEYRELARANLLSGPDAWAPMALSGGKLVLRDLSRMICVDLSAANSAAKAP